MLTGLEETGGRVNGQLRRRGVEEGPIKITCSYDTMVVFK